MRTHSTIIFSLFLISSILLVTTVENSFGEDIIADGTGFENSVILELKNSRGNTDSIDTVRVWLSGDNEFKSFKTEQGWMGKNTPQGVIIFSSEKEIGPGENVKFGIKTIENNPTINWKAVNSNGEVISTASTKILTTDSNNEQTELNQPEIVAIKDESIFRFIPEKPNSNSEFRVVGENFVPDQELDFYIGNKLDKSIKVDGDGKILFSSKIPKLNNEERTEFILRDSGGNEKVLSFRVPQIENREIADIIKLSLGNTPQKIKRGDVINLEGMATPNTTLTVTNKLLNGDILNIETVQVRFDGKWSYDDLISPTLELGVISIEINDGKSKVLRNIEVISAKLINIYTIQTKFESGDIITFEGTAIPNTEMSIIVEDSIGAEIISRSVSVGELGDVLFNIEIPRGAIEGTYILTAYQNDEDGVTTFGIGQEPEPIIIVRPTKLNFSAGEMAEITIQGQPNAQVSIILIDSADREKFSDSINLGPDGKEIYKIDTKDMPTGSFTFNAKRGESSGSALFTVGLTTGSGAISIQTTRDEYKQGDQLLILGNTGATNVLLDITISDSTGKVIKKFETFSDRFGVFKVDNFRVPSDGEAGVWKINAKSGGNFKEFEFSVSGENVVLVVSTNKSNYDNNEFMDISGKGARFSATVTLTIFDSNANKIDELNITAKSNGEFLTLWKIPAILESGEYNMTADDGASTTTTKFTIN